MKKEYDMSGAKRGPIVVCEEGKTRITLYMDNKIIHHFRTRAEAIGKGYQTLINDALFLEFIAPLK